MGVSTSFCITAPDGPLAAGRPRFAVFGAATGDRMARNLASDRSNRTGKSTQREQPSTSP
ncbi:hypothetical protein BGLA2_1720015 [Burkholderia gladioli]|nr:hypothetical protein BGLA2_1720015 [Burkholderia gladioli]